MLKDTQSQLVQARAAPSSSGLQQTPEGHKATRQCVYSRAYHREYSLRVKQGVSPAKAKGLARTAGQLAVATFQ